jgi:hypothetical protein
MISKMIPDKCFCFGLNPWCLVWPGEHPEWVGPNFPDPRVPARSEGASAPERRATPTGGKNDSHSHKERP